MSASEVVIVGMLVWFFGMIAVAAGAVTVAALIGVAEDWFVRRRDLRARARLRVVASNGHLIDARTIPLVPRRARGA